MLTAGRTETLVIEKPAAGGPMIARADGHVVLVSGAIPGERARVLIERIGKGVAFGRVVDVEEASVDRRTPACDPLCGGSAYAHIAYPRQVAIKSQVIADAFARVGKVPWPHPIDIAASPERGYRMRARLHWRDGRLGFFREGSHDLCDHRTTGQLLESSLPVLDAVAAVLSASGFRERLEIELSENLDASSRAIHVETLDRARAEAMRDRARQVDGVTGLTAGQRDEPGRLQVLQGDPAVTDHLSVEGQPISLRRHVLAFFQGNRFLLESLVRTVVGSIDAGADVVDLYAGAGLFSLAAAVWRGSRVVAVEGDRLSAADLTHNARAAAGAVEAVHQSVEEFTTHVRPSPAVLIVDPPRTGMSRAALDGALGLRAATVIYVSCDVATLARDARRLLDAGYRLTTLQGFDLFPNTPHVEAVACFQRA
jgi:23S rRNA (uracil1939-C5)-methyltransferase